MKCDHSQLQFFFPGLSICPGKPRRPEGLGEAGREDYTKGSLAIPGSERNWRRKFPFNRYSAILASGLKSPFSPKEEIKWGFISWTWWGLATKLNYSETKGGKLRRVFSGHLFPNSLHSSWGELLFQKDLVLEKNDFLQGKHTPNWETPHCDDRLPHLLTQILVPFSYQTFLRPPRFSFPRLPEGSPGLSSMALQDEKRGPSHGHSSMGSQQDGLSLKKGRVKNDFSSSSSLHPTQQACDKRNELCSLLSPSLFPWASQIKAFSPGLRGVSIWKIFVK